MRKGMMGTQTRPPCHRRLHRFGLVTVWQDSGAEHVLGPGFQNAVQLLAFKSSGEGLGKVIGGCPALTSQRAVFKDGFKAERE